MNVFDKTLRRQIAIGLQWAAEGLTRDFREIGILQGSPLLVDLTDKNDPEGRHQDAKDWFKYQMDIYGLTKPDPRPEPEPETEPDPLREAVEAFVRGYPSCGAYMDREQYAAYRRMKELL